ncbi:hypothetical protein VPNG_00864 [Cytospora leucostoma]|uniref:Uncharacterized protein n=1 Tax=Cytospora leucostoma TaxID=1230097 RepID=A0A423XP07_9PEZI|nr:hypothetical protein VPNG_00864 [Cytospora leucostoma]
MAVSADIDPLLMEADASKTRELSNLKKITLYLGKLWIETRNDLRYDLKSTRWRRSAVTYFKWLFFSIWALGLLTFCIAFPLIITNGVALESLESWNNCAPDSTFSLERPSPWQFAWVFQIVLGFGAYNFTQVKIIDVAWDIGVGRLGQTILAYFSWKAFSVYVRLSMEHAPITYRTFWTTYMQHEASFRPIIRAIRDFTSRRGLRSKTAMIFMIATMVFIMAFPTLASAMTGYTANNNAVIKFIDGTQAPFTEFQKFEHIIHDGNRINLTSDYKVFSGKEGDVCGWDDCVAQYINKYGILNNTASNWTVPVRAVSDVPYIPIQSPTLNIEVHVKDDALFLYNNMTYNLPYLKDNAICQPVMVESQQTYQWGFSVIQLEVTLILLTMWTFGVWIMWLDTHLKLISRGEYQVPHELNAVLYLADAIRDDFKCVGEKPGSLANDDLRRYAREHLKGGKVGIQAPLSGNAYGLRLFAWNWLKTNKLCTISLLTATTILAFDLEDIMYGQSGWFAMTWGYIPLFFVMGFALAAGWSRKTRAVMEWAAFIAGTVVFLAVGLQKNLRGEYNIVVVMETLQMRLGMFPPVLAPGGSVEIAGHDHLR